MLFLQCFFAETGIISRRVGLRSMEGWRMGQWLIAGHENGGVCASVEIEAAHPLALPQHRTLLSSTVVHQESGGMECLDRVCSPSSPAPAQSRLSSIFYPCLRHFTPPGLPPMPQTVPFQRAHYGARGHLRQSPQPPFSVSIS